MMQHCVKILTDLIAATLDTFTIVPMVTTNEQMTSTEEFVGLFVWV